MGRLQGVIAIGLVLATVLAYLFKSHIKKAVVFQQLREIL